MKKVILLTFTALVMVACRLSVEDDTKNCTESYHVIILDSCEYYSNNTQYDLTHKGNCRFCKERDSIKWEKRKKELEELVIMKTCFLCKNCYLDMDNNYRCELKKYPESNIVCRNWGQWKIDAEKCNDYKVRT